MEAVICKICRECRFKETCNNKILEALAEMVVPLQPSLQKNTDQMLQPLIQPSVRKRDLRNIKIAPDIWVTIDLEELKEQMNSEHMIKITCMFKNGARKE